jgi:hypothetical protein
MSNQNNNAGEAYEGSSTRDMVGSLCLMLMCPGSYSPTDDPTIVACDTCRTGLPRWLTKNGAMAWAVWLEEA